MLLCGTRVGQVTQVIGPFKMATFLRTNSLNIPEMGNLNSRMRRISFLMRTAKSCNLQRVQKLCELFFFGVKNLRAHDPTRRSGTFSFRLILLIVNNSKEKFQSEISKNNIYFVQRKASRNQWITECIKTNDAGNSQSTRLLQYLRRSSVFPVRLFVDMPHDLPCILSCD